MKYAAVFVFILMLAGCDQENKQVGATKKVGAPLELNEFIQGVKNSLVFVEGGDFLMGDYGLQYGPEKLPYDADGDSKPLHMVKLSGYSIGKYKISNQEYQLYQKFNELKPREDISIGWKENWEDVNSAPSTPAHMDWFEAEQYCAWLAKVTDFPFSLPTEAQWEYAARSRGQFMMVATDDGSYKATQVRETEYDGPRGINISSRWDRETFAKKMGWKTGAFTPLPVGSFPPNPLGLYAMSDNGLEWVKDWYDPNYYQYSPVNDPQGPANPVFKGPASNNKYAKVLRGVGFADPMWGGGVNVQRSYGSPDAYLYNPVLKADSLQISDKTARCVVNSPGAVK